MLTWLRIVVSCFCLVLCVLFAALWVRSWFCFDYIDYYERRYDPRDAPRDYINLWSGSGLTLIGKGTGLKPSQYQAEWSWHTIDPFPPIHPLNPTILGHRWHNVTDSNGNNYKYIQCPILSLMLITGLLASIAKPKPRWQFGMRELFMLSTVGAITIGTLAAVLRAIWH